MPVATVLNSPLEGIPIPSTSFAYPWVLMLWVIPIWLLSRVWWRRIESGVALPFDHGQQATGYGWRFALCLTESLPPLILAVVIAILAGPRQLSEPRTRRALTNIEFCVDISGSMTASFGDGSRYDASMQAINEFLDFRQGDAFGLTFFGNSVLHWVPLTSDVSAFRCAPPFMRPEVAPPWFGGTEIGKALMACRSILVEREQGDRMIVLVSDGYSSDLFGGNDLKLAQTFNDDEIVVYAVHIGGGEPPDPIVNITGLTGGEVFNPGDVDGLRGVFRRIDDMQQAELEKTVAESLDDYAGWSVLGLSLGALYLASLFGLRYTPW